MLNVYTAKRREPRVHLRVAVMVEGMAQDGRSFTCETFTVDLSNRGASVILDEAVTMGQEVVFQAARYPFRTTAIVRSIARVRATGDLVVGLEFQGGVTNPLVRWPSDDVALAGEVQP